MPLISTTIISTSMEAAPQVRSPSESPSSALDTAHIIIYIFVGIVAAIVLSRLIWMSVKAVYRKVRSSRAPSVHYLGNASPIRTVVETDLEPHQPRSTKFQEFSLDSTLPHPLPVFLLPPLKFERDLPAIGAYHPSRAPHSHYPTKPHSVSQKSSKTDLA